MKIKLTENKLKQIVAESVKNVLNEKSYGLNFDAPSNNDDALVTYNFCIDKILKSINKEITHIDSASKRMTGEDSNLGRNLVNISLNYTKTLGELKQKIEDRLRAYSSAEDAAYDDYTDAVRKGENPLGGLNRNDWA